MTNNETIHVAPSGDLRILLSGSADSMSKRRKLDRTTRRLSPNDVQRTFTVSSAVMRLASPVWKTMLDPRGHFKESSSNGEVHFVEDNPAALLLILRIAHLQFRKVPESLDFHELVDLAIVCDKYDTAGLVRPWVKKWEGSLKERSILVAASGCEDYLFCAWTFGDLSTYEKIANRLVTDSTYIEGHLFADGNWVGRNLPPGAIGEFYPGGALNVSTFQEANTDCIKDCILEARRKTITALLEACSKLVESYESNGVLCQAKFDVKDDFQEFRQQIKQCDTLVYGCLIKGLRTLHLWPGPILPTEVHKSLKTLTNELRSMACFVLGGGTAHAKCVFTKKLAKELETIELNIPSGVDDPLRKHMEEQAEK